MPIEQNQHIAVSEISIVTDYKYVAKVRPNDIMFLCKM
jgi:hypothetical protein